MSTEEQAKQALIELCDRLEKLPRVAFKDGQTFTKIDYEEVDFLISEARKAIGVEHIPVPNKPDAPLFVMELMESYRKRLGN